MMSEEQQNRIADLFLKHLQGRLTENENEELQKILASSKSARISFDTISDPEKLTNPVAKRNIENKKDRKAIKEWIINQIDSRANR